MKAVFQSKPAKEYVQGVSYACRVLWSMWEVLVVINGILYNIFEDENGEKVALLIAPYQIRRMIFEKLHCARTAGHLGRDKSLKSIKNRFYWPGMTKDVARWCKACDSCARVKGYPGVGKYYLQQSAVGAPFDRIGIDIVGPCPISVDGNEYIIVICDYFSKWTEAFAVKNHTALTVADKLVTEVFCRFGLVAQIHSDQGREFESELFKEICNLLGIQKTRTCPYRPQSDGLVERTNRSLIQMLSIFVNENRNDWDDHLPYLLMAYRSTMHDSTGCSPYKMLFGRELTGPLDVISGLAFKNKTFRCPIAYVEWVKYSLKLTHDFACQNLQKAALRQKKNYDRGVKPRTYDAGNFVWRWYPPSAAIKFGEKKTGPYLIRNKITDVLYQVQKEPNGRMLVIHVDDLVPYEGESIPEVWQNDSEIFSELTDFENQNLTDNSEVREFDLLHDDADPQSFGGEVSEIEDINQDLSEENLNVPEFKTPPRLTRCGRQVRRPLKYSPSDNF